MEQVARGRARGTAQTVDDLAGRLIITEALDYDEQTEAVQDAAEFAAEVELIVLDSATGFYRLRRDDEDGGETLRDVARQITHRLSLARKHDLAVLTNQVYADPDCDRTRALGGHTLEHWTGTVVRLDRFRGGNRRATLEKHRAKPAGDTAQFRSPTRDSWATTRPKRRRGRSNLDTGLGRAPSRRRPRRKREGRVAQASERAEQRSRLGRRVVDAASWCYDAG